MSEKNIWNQIIKNLQSTISTSEINTWFSTVSLSKLDKDVAIIAVPNKFVAGWFKDHYIETIQKYFKEILNYLPEIQFTYTRTISIEDTPKYKTQKKAITSINHTLNPMLTFSNFITSKSNRFACSLASDIVHNPEIHYNPLYLFSNLSSGKTHLLNAIGNQIIKNNPLEKIIYLSMEQLSLYFSIATKNKTIRKFWEYYTGAKSLLIIDDIHLIGGLLKLQKELITIFNYYYESKKQIVIAGRLPPGQIRNLLPELRSRLEWGLLSELQLPDQKTRMKIIKKKAKEENIPLPDDVAFYLATSTEDLKKLMKQLISIGNSSSCKKGDINIHTVKRIIKNIQSISVDITDIQKLTANLFNISLTDILSNKKTYKFSYPRHLAMYLSRELTGLSFKEIARAFGNKDHSTIIYAVKHIEKDKEKKGGVMADLDRLQNLIL